MSASAISLVQAGLAPVRAGDGDRFDIPFAKPSITAREIRFATDAAANGWGRHCYDYLNRFERDFAAYVGARYAIATSSCTGALHIAMRALGIGPGDEVIVPEATWIASVAPITYEGARPVIVDIDPVSWCLDPAAVERAITPRTRAIIAVHLYGNLADMPRLRDIAQRNGLHLIEDAAEALGSEQGGHKAGGMADAGVFSFHGTKTLTTGEGGMFVCQSEAIYRRALLQSSHGRKPERHSAFWMDEIGVKYKMSNLQAAIGCAQLERIEELVERKRQIFRYYAAALGDLGLDTNVEAPGDRNCYWLPTVVARGRLDETKRDELLARANAKGIGLRPFFYALHRFPMFDHEPVAPVAASLCGVGFNLPSFHDMSEADLDVVVKEVRQAVAGKV